MSALCLMNGKPQWRTSALGSRSQATSLRMPDVQGTRQPRLATPGGTGDRQVLRITYPVTPGQGRHQ